MNFSRMKFSNIFKKPLPTYDWKFGKRSLSKLEGVNDDLVRVTNLALTYSPVDFGITCGLRTQAEQNKLFEEGKSQVRHSRHQDGLAVDIVVYVNGKVTWEFKHYVVAAQAFARAARELNVDIRWGAAWNTLLNLTDAQDAHDNYVAVRKAHGKKAFIDGPHFEMVK